jgi:hypothetical protein
VAPQDCCRKVVITLIDGDLSVAATRCYHVSAYALAHDFDLTDFRGKEVVIASRTCSARSNQPVIDAAV